LELPPNRPVVDSDAVVLAVDVEDEWMLEMPARECANAVGGEELALVEQARKNAAELGFAER
jgi:hypothetical protein